MIDLAQLRLFIAAAEYGGFAEAARALYTSHSTVSRAVSALEKELGVALLVRSNRLLGLTPAGELLLREGRVLLAAADSLCEKVKEQA